MPPVEDRPLRKLAEGRLISVRCPRCGRELCPLRVAELTVYRSGETGWAGDVLVSKRCIAEEPVSNWPAGTTTHRAKRRCRNKRCLRHERPSTVTLADFRARAVGALQAGSRVMYLDE